MKLLLLILLFSCGKEKTSEKITDIDLEISNKIKGLDLLLPSKIEEIPFDPKNLITQKKIELGKLLFHETKLAMNPKNPSNLGKYSCASCHRADAGFSSGNLQGIGEGGLGDLNRINNSYDSDIQNLKSPTALNVAFQKNTLWNGKLGYSNHNLELSHLFVDDGSILNLFEMEGVETQVLAGLKVHRLIDENNDLNNSFLNEGIYKNLFQEVFDGDISFLNVAKSIAAYERSILSNEAPFQLYLKGNKNALSYKEKQGLLLFLGKAKCIQCHNGPSLSDGNFYKIGFKDFPLEITNGSFKDFEGRSSFTNDYIDLFRFKTSQLYNLKDHHSLGHGGSFRSIKDVIKYKNKGISENRNVIFLDINSLNLNPDEIENISLFLEKSLYDPNLLRYQPVRLPNSNNFPNEE